MTENLPWYISATFIITTFVTVGMFFYAAKRGAFTSFTTKFLSFALPFWIFFEATLALIGFHQNQQQIPPRIVLFGVAPAIICALVILIFAAKNFVALLPLSVLTLIHVVRVPIEIVLWWLSEVGMVPRLMTFGGRNFDILAGITAPFIWWLAFRDGKINRPLLFVWNIFALLLLVNIVFLAALSVPTPMQQFGFDVPNVAVTYFPFIWLPTVIVPIILFCHLASFRKLFLRELNP
jgi:hypothetical protein